MRYIIFLMKLWFYAKDNIIPIDTFNYIIADIVWYIIKWLIRQASVLESAEFQIYMNITATHERLKSR